MFHFGSTDFDHTIAGLQARGFDRNFCFMNGQVVCAQSQASLNPYELSTIEMHFYPGEDQCSIERMLYAITAAEYAIKGLLVINGLNNNILFLQMMSGKNRPQATNQKISIDLKCMTTEDVFLLTSKPTIL